MLVKFISRLFLVFTLFGISQVQTDTNLLINRTHKFIDSFGMPMKITIFGCWSGNYQKIFWKSLSVKYPVNYVRKINQNYKIHVNQLYIIDLSCNNSMGFLKYAQRLNMFKIPNKWLLFGSMNNLLEFYFGIDSEIFIINPEHDKFQIKMIYKIQAIQTKFIENSITNYQDFSISKRQNLLGCLLKISFVFINPDSLNHLNDYRNTHIDAISKLNYFLTMNLMDYLNASYTYIIRETWGYKNSTTGLYSGMVGDLQIGLSDIGGTALFFTKDRVDVVDYIAPTSPTKAKFIFKSPPLSYVTNVFTLPFNSSVWHYCIIMTAIVIVFIYLIVLWEWKEIKFKEIIINRYFDPLRPHFFDVVMLEIGAITQQGSDTEPKSVSGRIITIFTFLTLMFLYTAYSANIVALLQSTTDSMQTLEDLLNSRIKLGAEDIVYNHYYFENAQEPIRKAIYEKKVAPINQKSNFLKAEEGIRRVQNEFFGFYIELSTGYKLISKTFHEGEKCALKEIPYEDFIDPWLALPNKSPYREIIKIGMKKMHERGIQNREIRKIYSRKPQCQAGSSNFGSVGLIDCYSAFLIFGIGFGLAFLILVFEIISKKISTH